MKITEFNVDLDHVLLMVILYLFPSFPLTTRKLMFRLATKSTGLKITDESIGALERDVARSAGLAYLESRTRF